MKSSPCVSVRQRLAPSQSKGYLSMFAGHDHLLLAPLPIDHLIIVQTKRVFASKKMMARTDAILCARLLFCSPRGDPLPARRLHTHKLIALDHGYHHHHHHHPFAMRAQTHKHLAPIWPKEKEGAQSPSFLLSPLNFARASKGSLAGEINAAQFNNCARFRPTDLRSTRRAARRRLAISARRRRRSRAAEK